MNYKIIFLEIFGVSVDVLQIILTLQLNIHQICLEERNKKTGNQIEILFCFLMVMNLNTFQLICINCGFKSSVINGYFIFFHLFNCSH